MQNKENDNLKAGEAFLAENGKRENVVSLPSGLQYEIIKQGDGPKPSANNTVTCHYHGTTINGDVFDSSVKRGQPASFPLNGVIKGWTEALQLMQDTEYGLTAAIYSQSFERAEAMMKQINTGTVYWNCCDRVSATLPWSGRKHSGLGATLSYQGIRAFVQPKAYHIRNTN